jgi:hypothetical protein
MDVRIGDESPATEQFETTCGFLNDKVSLKDDDLVVKWDSRLEEFSQARFVVERFITAVIELKGWRRGHS